MERVCSRGSREVDAGVGEGVGLGRVVKVVGTLLACRLHGGVVAAWMVAGVGGTLTWVGVRVRVEVKVVCSVGVVKLRIALPG